MVVISTPLGQQSGNDRDSHDATFDINVLDDVRNGGDEDLLAVLLDDVDVVAAGDHDLYEFAKLLPISGAHL